MPQGPGGRRGTGHREKAAQRESRAREPSGALHPPSLRALCGTSAGHSRGNGDVPGSGAGSRACGYCNAAFSPSPLPPAPHSRADTHIAGLGRDRPDTPQLTIAARCPQLPTDTRRGLGSNRANRPIRSGRRRDLKGAANQHRSWVPLTANQRSRSPSEGGALWRRAGPCAPHRLRSRTASLPGVSGRRDAAAGPTALHSGQAGPEHGSLPRLRLSAMKHRPCPCRTVGLCSRLLPAVPVSAFVGAVPAVETRRCWLASTMQHSVQGDLSRSLSSCVQASAGGNQGPAAP